MLTLGVHDGHTATATLMEDGRVVACVSEERLVHEKEWTGFPARSIAECLVLAGRGADEIDAVGVCSLMPQMGNSGYFRPAWHKRAFGLVANVLPRSLLQSPANVDRVQALGRVLFRGRQDRIRRQLTEAGVTTPNVHFYDHHLCHAATTHFANWNRQSPETLVITLDGSGDGVCATINIARGAEIDVIARTFNYNSICDFYTRVTQYLGMKPMSHEFKVMGMAPYASGKYMDDIVARFRSWFRIDPRDPLQIINDSGVWKWQFIPKMRRELGLARFDNVAGAAQAVFEEVVLQWVRNAIAHTGIGHVALSGGGFMNVKLNYLISELPEVESLFVFPSCGDESNPVGAAYLAARDAGFDMASCCEAEVPYWGRAYTNDDVKAAIDATPQLEGMKITLADDANDLVAEKVAEGRVVGRSVGRMEWGARALGNRSIVADPRNPQIIHKINKAIKMRDFWMPFAPAILESYRERYVKLRPDFQCPFMTIATETREAAHDAITAGLHPFDRTARCQVLDPVRHPHFHDLVAKFERRTGVGGVLNTSFNLHGDPIVMSPQDAIRTFLNSGLDVLQVEDWVIEKVD